MRVPLGNYSQGTQVFVTFIKDARNFYPRFDNVNSENSMQGARLVNKGGKIGKKRNNQTRLGRKKMVIFFFLLCFLELIFKFSLVEKELNCPQRPKNCYSVAIHAKQSGTVKTVEHSKNDHYECS